MSCNKEYHKTSIIRGFVVEICNNIDLIQYLKKNIHFILNMHKRNTAIYLRIN